MILYPDFIRELIHTLDGFPFVTKYRMPVNTTKEKIKRIANAPNAYYKFG